MPDLYITKQYYKAMPIRSAKSPRDRFVRYYNDLFDLEGIARPALDAYLNGNQYSYCELGDAVLSEASKDLDLSKLDCFVVAYWGHEFDPDGSFGAYFSTQYNIQSRMFDVCDQGVLSPITAIALIQAYANAGVIKNAALLCFDQNSIPLEENYSGSIPSRSSARVLFFNVNDSSHAKYKVISSEIEVASSNGVDEKNVIKIDESSSDFSASDIFNPIFNADDVNSISREIGLRVLDSESEKQGFIRLIKQN